MRKSEAKKKEADSPTVFYSVSLNACNRGEPGEAREELHIANYHVTQQRQAPGFYSRVITLIQLSKCSNLRHPATMKILHFNHWHPCD